jgi:hypothetical protein
MSEMPKTIIFLSGCFVGAMMLLWVLWVMGCLGSVYAEWFGKDGGSENYNDLCN